MPADTPDPTPFVYDKTLYSMAGLCTCAWVTNALLKPVDPKLHIKGGKLHWQPNQRTPLQQDVHDDDDYYDDDDRDDDSHHKG